MSNGATPKPDPEGPLPGDPDVPPPEKPSAESLDSREETNR
jgi:hypothetical protein